MVSSILNSKNKGKYFKIIFYFMFDKLPVNVIECLKF